MGGKVLPADFPYREVYLRGYPHHDPLDDFRLRHPSMVCARRAKIFAPFDALRGFGEAVAAKEVLYEFKKELSEEEKEELNRRMNILRRLTGSSRAARQRPIPVQIICFVPCQDPHSSAYGNRGQYRTAAGPVRKWGEGSLLIGEQWIRWMDIIAIESSFTVYDEWLGEERGIFETGWETDAP